MFFVSYSGDEGEVVCGRWGGGGCGLLSGGGVVVGHNGD